MRGVLRRSAPFLPLALLALAALRLQSSTGAPDDAFITLRYAENLAGGEGFRYNPGGERVEGFSSPLHVLLLAGAAAAGAPLEDAAQAIGLLAALGLVFATWLLGRRLLGLGWGTLAACGLALSPALAAWSRSGMETTLAALLVLASVGLALRGRHASAFLAAGLVAVARPEGALYLLPLIGWTILASGPAPTRTAAWRTVMRRAAPAFLIPFSWLAFRLAYFGDPLPNTFYAKMDGVSPAQVQRGLSYVQGAFARAEIHLPLLIAGAAALLLLAGWLRRRGTPTSRDHPAPAPWPWLLAGSAAVTVFFAIVSGGDHLPNQRFLLPALAPLHLLGAWGGRALAGAVPRHDAAGGGAIRRTLVAVLVGGIFLSQGLRIAAHEIRHPRQPLDRPWRLVEARNDSHICNFYRLGQALRRQARPGETIALVPAGAIAYASGLAAIDMLGLNDRQIAHRRVADMGRGRAGHEKGSGELVLSRRPDYILLHHAAEPTARGPQPPSGEDLTFVPVRELWESADFHRLYEPVVVPIDEARGYTVYRRR